MDGEAATAGHCGVLTADQGALADYMRALQGALYARCGESGVDTAATRQHLFSLRTFEASEITARCAKVRKEQAGRQTSQQTGD